MTAHQPGSPPPSPDVPRASPVLDIEAGVERLMGNRAIYLRALARFRNDYRNATGAIRHALDADNGPEARRLAHTLKGAAGMIEAPALYAAALALEHGLRDGAGGVVDALLAHAGAALDVRLLTHASDAHTGSSSAAIVPLAPLAANTTYDVSFTGTADSAPVTRSWSFTTR